MLALSPGESVLSEPMTIAGEPWQLVMYPRGQQVPAVAFLDTITGGGRDAAAIGPSHGRAGRVGVYLRYLAPDTESFVDACFRLELVRFVWKRTC